MYLFIFKSKNDNKPNFAPLHFSINHVACNIHITSTWTPIDACADRLWPTKYQKTLHRRDENNHHHPDLFDTLKEQNRQCEGIVIQPSLSLRGWLLDCWVSLKTCCTGGMLPPGNMEKQNARREAVSGKNPHRDTCYLRKLLKGSCSFLISIRRPSDNNHRPVQSHHHFINTLLVVQYTAVVMESYQQFMLALAIPPRAWMSPGPETTRQAPGLDSDNHRKQQHVNNSAGHQLFTLFGTELDFTSQ